MMLRQRLVSFSMVAEAVVELRVHVGLAAQQLREPEDAGERVSSPRARPRRRAVRSGHLLRLDELPLRVA